MSELAVKCNERPNAANRVLNAFVLLCYKPMRSDGIWICATGWRRQNNYED